ncbi:hypothetical protein GCM10017771_31270 [Streptomyces capitiformicae]|uniref:Uncharacterized protein n=1 Tax=Streptomyces capitiformicae TaxID=2014920 RepID=A0A919L8K9_9ACTN|nr:hypothetical protein GCM10017771_31270 [Streptomyces capitiformicae]
MTITDAIHQAVLKIPKKAWTPAYDTDGTERPGAWVEEITDIPDLTTWPKDMRLPPLGTREAGTRRLPATDRVRGPSNPHTPAFTSSCVRRHPRIRKFTGE